MPTHATQEWTAGPWLPITGWRTGYGDKSTLLGVGTVPAYRIVGGDSVELRGIWGPNTAASTAFGNAAWTQPLDLPVDLRPAFFQTFTIAGWGGRDAVFEIHPTGLTQVIVYISNVQFLDLGGSRYYLR